MPGYDVLDSQLKGSTSESVAKYRCPQCRRLLRDAVQPSCGHWLCQDCAVDIFANKNPRCPRDDCGEQLEPEDGQDFFPDRFVRREIMAFLVICTFHSLGCPWEGRLAEYEQHKASCTYAQETCECGKTMPRTELSLHKKTLCPLTKKPCPLSKLGCPKEQEMTNAELCAHFSETTDIIDHFEMLASTIQHLMKVDADTPHTSFSVPAKRLPAIGSEHTVDSGIKSLQTLTGRDFDEEKDFGGEENASRSGSMKEKLVPAASKDMLRSLVEEKSSHVQKLKAVTSHPPMMGDDYMTKMPLYTAEALGGDAHFPKFLQDELEKARRESKTEYLKELEALTFKVKTLEQQVSVMQKTIATKNAEIEDRDFRLSLIENSNYDGTMIWKIPQFTQRMSDAQSGKYTSIFSLPFYSSRYGYKMCLRLYIMGDGIGKNTHMSLFFVMMRGEFDNILPWPFTQRVTFRLINQGKGRDVVDTFQPDPLSSSFKKPKSDMNIASGCPRFISHDSLKSGGFIAEDTIFIKCVVDRSTLSHP